MKDPATAELLSPKDYPLTAKRPPLGHYYYENVNRGNVSLIDVSGDPITEITAKGVRTASREFEADLIVFATGFDAVTGTLKAMDVRGRSGVTIAEKWKDGPRTHLGITVDGFPNFFMVLGPQSPFANIPVVIDGMVDCIGRAIRHLREKRSRTLKPDARSGRSWRKHVDALVNATVLSKGRSWFLGDNIPGQAARGAVPLRRRGRLPEGVPRGSGEGLRGLRRYLRRDLNPARMSCDRPRLPTGAKPRGGARRAPGLRRRPPRSRVHRGAGRSARRSRRGRVRAVPSLVLRPGSRLMILAREKQAGQGRREPRYRDIWGD